jgi:molybdopterin/thiamine biosynthesis adenylyltransferase
MMDYTRNWALNQEKISNAKITIVGSGKLAEFLMLYVAGLGLGNARVVSDKCGPTSFIKTSGYQVFALEEIVKRVNNEINVEPFPVDLDDYVIGKTDVLLDLTNDDRSKYMCEKILDKRNVKHFISASSDKTFATVKFLPGYSFKRYESHEQGKFSSAIIAAIILDEVRKFVAPMDNEEFIEGIDYGLCIRRRFKDGSQLYNVNLKKPKVMVCGAGGIGTYVALNLAMEGLDLDIFDGDVIESHNVARQILYYGKIGQPKVDVLKERLEAITRVNIKAYNEFVTEDTMLGDYDVLVCCADNWEARKVMNDFAVESHTPLINASVTSFSGYAEAYVPGVNCCLDCRYDLEKLVKLKPQSCAQMQESNVIMNNALIGAVVAGEVLNGNYGFLCNRFEYHSKLGKRKFGSVVKKYRREKCRCVKSVKNLATRSILRQRLYRR